MATFFSVADLTDPNDPEGRTYRQVNAARTHAIPIGALVELKTGERLRVKSHTRDCDQTPLYSLGLSGTNEDKVARMRWYHGYDDESLTVVTPHARTLRRAVSPRWRWWRWKMKTAALALAALLAASTSQAEVYSVGFEWQDGAGYSLGGRIDTTKGRLDGVIFNPVPQPGSSTHWWRFKCRRPDGPIRVGEAVMFRSCVSIAVDGEVTKPVKHEWAFDVGVLW